MSSKAAAPEPVFVVGLYKNGTSWLTSALAAHPQYCALWEVDVLRSVAGRSGRRLLPPHRRLANIFGKSAFCALRAEQLAPGAFRQYLTGSEVSAVRRLYDLPSGTAIQVISRMLGARGRRLQPKADMPVGFINFAPELLDAAYCAVRDADSVAAAIEGFLNSLRPGYPADRRLVLKGADQVLCLDALCELYPHAPKIAIVRDGRDAAVSAFHYRALMRERRMAWQHGHLSYMRPVVLLREASSRSVTAMLRAAGFGEDWRLARSMYVWADRVRRVLVAAERGELYVLRYEDLLSDFAGCFFALLSWLGADTDPAVVAAVSRASAFESMTGRPPGVSGRDVMRRGVAGEWREVLTQRDQALAWRIAGAELAAMGYSRDGDAGRFGSPNDGPWRGN